jgi:hypothetical protein
MPTSKKRGGKKAHNKRVTKRNETVAKREHAMQMQFMNMLKQQMETQKEENNG